MSVKTEINDKRRRKIIISIILGILAILGLTFAWFYYKQKVASITKVAQPGKIIISGVHGRKLEEIDLSGGEIDSNNKVTVRNVICVDSAKKDIILQLAHTTNASDLSFRIYPASENDSEPASGEYMKESDDGKDYYYTYNSEKGYTTKKTGEDKESMIQMSCLNKDSSNPEIARQEGDYHDQTYGVNENKIQIQAEPLYWTSSEVYDLPLTSKSDGDQGSAYVSNSNIRYEFYGYFVLEASWTEKDKETDIVYIMAK